MSIPNSVISKSTMTAPQVECLKTYLRVKSKQITLREAAASRSDKQTTIGSYYRTVQQGRNNLRSSVMTLVIGLWLGLVRADDLQKLFDLIGRGLPELEDEEKERAVALIEVLLDKIVL
jgi:hypothetical protein